MQPNKCLGNILSLWRLPSSEIDTATHHFSPNNLVGEGLFSTVYKACLHGTDVAVKQIKLGVLPQSNFWAYISKLENVRHPHILLVIGICEEKRCIVQEFMPGGSLGDMLKLDCPETRLLHWLDRFRIALEISSGLLHMHIRNILHGDLRPVNVLLDKHNTSKLADAGLAGLYQRAATMFAKTNDSLYYIDPHHQETGQELTEESDVYSLGLVLLQLFTGIRDIVRLLKLLCEVEIYANENSDGSVQSQREQESQNHGVSTSDLATSVRQAFSRWGAGLERAVERMASKLDPKAGEWPMEEASSVLRLGLRCVEKRRELRPRLQEEVVSQLYEISHKMEADSSDRINFMRTMPREFLWGKTAFAPINLTATSESLRADKGFGSPFVIDPLEKECYNVTMSSDIEKDCKDAQPQKPLVRHNSASPPTSQVRGLKRCPLIQPEHRRAASVVTSREPSPPPKLSVRRTASTFSSRDSSPPSTDLTQSPPGPVATPPSEPHWARKWGTLMRMQRRVGIVQNWEQRFFTLNGDPLRLCCYKSLPAHDESPQKEYILGSSTKIVNKGGVMYNGKELFSFSIQGNGFWPLVLAAFSRAESESWRRSLENNINAEFSGPSSSTRKAEQVAKGGKRSTGRPVRVLSIDYHSDDLDGASEDIAPYALATDGEGMLWSSHGPRIYSWDENGEKVFDLSDQRSIDRITSLAVSRKDSSIWSGSESGWISKWEWKDGDSSFRRTASSFVGERISCIIATMDGAIWTAHNRSIETWGYEEGSSSCESLTLFRIHKDVVEVIIEGVNGVVWSASNDGTIRAWRQYQGCVMCVDEDIGPIVALGMGEESILWAASSSGKVIAIKDRKCVMVIEGHTEIPPRALVVAPNGCVWTGHADNSMKCWDSYGKCVATLFDHNDVILALVIGKDETLWSSSVDGEIIAWRLVSS